MEDFEERIKEYLKPEKTTKIHSSQKEVLKHEEIVPPKYFPAMESDEFLANEEKWLPKYKIDNTVCASNERILSVRVPKGLSPEEELRYVLEDAKKKTGVNVLSTYSVSRKELDGEVEIKYLAPPEILYHGTTGTAAEKALKEGLIPKLTRWTLFAGPEKKGGRPPLVYMGGCFYESAHEEVYARWDKKPPTVLAIDPRGLKVFCSPWINKPYGFLFEWDSPERVPPENILGFYRKRDERWYFHPRSELIKSGDPGRGISITEATNSSQKIPPEVKEEIRDLIEAARKHKTFDEFMYYISIVRSRPYSRISALIEPEEGNVTLEDACEGRLKWAGEELEDYVHGRGLWAAGKSFCKPTVTIYRGGSEIKPGDWVSLEEEYASFHGEPVYKLEVPWTDVVWAGTYEKEWYYVPKHLQGLFKSLREFWEFAKSRDPEKVISITEAIKKAWE